MGDSAEILIVPESLTESEQLKHLLELHGYRVSVEHNGKLALAAMRHRKPQIVISAIIVPEMDGYELCREIKGDESLKNIPVILLTSLSDAADIIRGLQCGADNFVTKPYDEKLLVSRIEYILLNRELREGARTQTALEIIFGGEKYLITPERQQIVDLLISTYETAVQKNLELIRAEKELKALNEGLEEEVNRRTAQLVGEIGERRAAEAALTAGEERYRRLVELSPETIAVHCEGRLVYVNAAGVKLLGAAGPDELIGKPILDITHPDYRDVVLPSSRQEQQGEQSPLVEQKFVRLDGQVIDVEVGEIATIHHNKPAVQIIVRDITESKRTKQALRETEARLQQAQKMEAIGRLAGGVAHDFNNLLTIILGNTQLELAKRKLEPDDPSQLRLLEVEQAGNRASVLTRQLLAFSRRQRLERRTINLNDTITEIMKLLQRIIGEDVEVCAKAAPDLSAVYADPAQIEQVLINLGVNARDAMPDGGQLTIETTNIDLDESYRRRYPYVQPGQYVEIRVSDTGCGMDEETQTHVFEPFFTTKEIAKGTGLGLSMVYGIIKQHDGHINVYSEVGHGTTFKIFLPVDVSAVEREEQPIRPPLLGGTETILVAEDEEALRNLARDILEGLGYTVILARNGEEAVKIYMERREQIAMLLLDVVMPRMGGLQAYARVRELGGNVPLIFMTGYSSETVQSRSVEQDQLIEEWDAVVIQKPYSVDGLGRKVRDLLDKARRKLNESQ